MPLNNKGRLQEYTVKNGLAAPLYRTSFTGQSHTPTWNCTVSVGSQTVNGDPSETKKEAEMSAAYRMLDILTGRVVDRPPVKFSMECNSPLGLNPVRRTLVTLLIDCDTHWMMLQEMSSGIPANLRVWTFSREPFNPIDPAIPIRNVAGALGPHITLSTYLGAELRGDSDVIVVASGYHDALLAAAKGLCGTKIVFAVNTYRDILETLPGL